VKTTRKRLARPSLRSVLATRHGALAVSLACALLTIAIVVIAIGQAKHTPKATPQQATVLVATTSIAKGTTAQTIAAQHLYKEEPVLASQVSPAAVSNAGSLAGTVAAANILPGEQLTSTDFVVTHGPIAQLQPNQRAIAVTLDAQHGLTGAIQTGDHVDVYGSYSVGPNGKTTVGLIYPDATVLSPNVGSHSAASASTGSGAILLAVDQDASADVAYTADYGKLWLVLRPTTTTNPSQSLVQLNSILGDRQILATIKATLGGQR
jgi:pilus assembly protein CpaB